MAEQTKALMRERALPTKASGLWKRAGRMKPLQTKQTRRLMRAEQAKVLKMVAQEMQVPKTASQTRSLTMLVYQTRALKTEHLTWNPVQSWQVAVSETTQRRKTRQSKALVSLKENQKAY